MPWLPAESRTSIISCFALQVLVTTSPDDHHSFRDNFQAPCHKKRDSPLGSTCSHIYRSLHLATAPYLDRKHAVTMPVYKCSFNYYRILRIHNEAEYGEIKKSYRELSLQFHPDKNSGCLKASEKFKTLSNAHEVLIDPDLREQYDIWRKCHVNLDDCLCDGFWAEEPDFWTGEDGAGIKQEVIVCNCEACGADGAGGKGNGDIPFEQRRSTPYSFIPEPTPKAKPKYSTYWFNHTTMTPFYESIRDAFDRARELHQEAQRELGRASLYRRSEVYIRAKMVEQIRRMNREERADDWTEARRIANQLRQQVKEEEKRVRKADRERMKASQAKKSGAY